MRLRSLSLWFFKALLFFSLGIILFGTGLLGRLYFKPMTLDSYQKEIELSFQKLAPEYSFQITHPELIWKGLGHPLEVKAAQIQVKGPQAFILNIPEFSADFSWIRLIWKRQWVPRSLTLLRPQLTLEGNLSQTLASSGKSPETLAPLFFFFSVGQEKSSLKTLEIQDASILLKQTALPDLKFQGVHFLFARRKEHTQVQIKGRLLKQETSEPHLFETHFEYDRTRQTLQGDLSLQVSEIKAEARGSLLWHPQTRTFQVKMTGEVLNMPLPKLGAYWPASVAPVPREWVLKNIQQGNVPKATVRLEGSFDLAHPDQNRIEHLTGDIQVKGASVDYLEGLPPAKDVEGMCHYTASQFEIDVEKGRCEGLKLGQSHLLITELDQKDQNIVLDLNIQAPFEKAITFLNHKPLEYPKKLGLNFKDIQGNSVTKLTLKFPLERTVSLPQVQVHSHSDLENIQLLYEIGEFPVALTQGKFTVDVTQKGFLVQGTAQGNDYPLRMTWEKAFEDRAHPLMTLKMTSSLPSRILKKYDWFKEKMIQGLMPLTLSYVVPQQEQATLTAQIDLTPCDIHLSGFKKGASIPAHLSLILELSKNFPERLRELKLTGGPGLDLSATALFKPRSYALKRLEIQKAKIGKNDFKATLEPSSTHTYRLSAEGEALDLEPFLEDLWDARKKEFSQNLEAILRFTKIYLDQGKTFYNNSLTFTYRDEKIQALTFQASLKNKNDRHRVSFSISSLAPQKRQMLLSTDSAGVFLNAMGLFENVKEGQLTLKATHDDGVHTNPWVGSMSLENFQLVKAPFLSKVLSLVFPTGFLHLFSEKGMPFHRLKTKFKASPYRLSLTNGRAYGPSLGFSFGGSLEQGYQTLNLHGTIIPAYFLNTLLSKIPLLGELLSGGKNEALFGVSYTIKGPRKDPIIGVNPLSAFTPGIFRKIFTTDEDYEEEHDEDDTKE